MAFSIFVTQAHFVIAEENPSTTDNYTSLMREYRLLSENKALDGLSLTETELQNKQADLKIRLEDFLASEQAYLATISIPEERKQDYYSQITNMINALALGETEIIYSASGTSEVSSLSALFDLMGDTPILDSPSSFDFFPDGVQLESLDLGSVDDLIQASGNIVPLSQNVPVLADVQEDGNEIVISEEIYKLTEELENNPVNITNYIKENITYEPYYGAKKGALGCLRERICNDADTASLSIALFRASGIPARYKKSPVLISIDQLKNLLGVEEARTVYAALSWNHIPVYVLDTSAQGIDLDTYDFSGETYFVVEWTHPEIYFEYDQLAGNRSSDLDFSSATSDPEVESILHESSRFSKKQWIGIEPVLQEYVRDPKEIIHDTAGFDTQAFWTNFLSYQGEWSPMEKYIDDLATQTGKDIREQQYQSTKSAVVTASDILPPTLPYFPISTATINTEHWSVLPSNRRHQVRISLRKQSDDTEVLSAPFYGNEINNAPINLVYEGATQADKDIIESYGGIYATPAHLIDIVPKLQSEGIQEVGTTPVSVGDALILKYEYLLDSNNLYTSEKFSVAGNAEGIFITLSKVAPDPTLNDESDPDRNSNILLGGNTALAREYWRKSEKNGDFLKKTLDVDYQMSFAQATVTQNRILSLSNGTPSAFDFNGLTIDASVHLNIYSNRGNYKNHFTDITLLLGEQLSYDEAQLFKDVAGLDAISTVQGLQYAYANPQDYTVYTITSSNESVVDSLDLSQNTKQNMHADIAEGNTIITPNKPVSKDGFTGILYISVKPDGTSGKYLIGEQVSNGGWTVDVMLNGEKVGSFYNEGDETNFVYADSILEEGKRCRILKAVFQSFPTSVVGYDVHVHGLPCLAKTTKDFGGIDHSYTLTTDAAKFESTASGYDYWVTENGVGDKIDIYITDNSGTLTPELIKVGNNFRTYDNFRFSPKLGTYIEGACEDQQSTYCPNNDESVLYYSPNTSGGNIFRAKGKILTKLDEDNQKAIQKLGMPTDHEQYATDSGFGSGGIYQNFMGGQVYAVTKKENEVLRESRQKAYYVPSEIDNYYNNNGGSGGKFGFPESDPYSYESGLAQNFEGTRIDNTAGHALHSPVWYKSKDGHHFLMVELNSELERRACFKHYIGLKNGVVMGDTDINGNLIEDYKERSFKDTLNSTDTGVMTNRRLNGFEPVAGFNGDLFDEGSGLHGIGYSLGIDYSGSANWSVMTMTKDNDVEIIKRNSMEESIAEMKNRIPNAYKYNVVAGLIEIIKNFDFKNTRPECKEALGSGTWWMFGLDSPCVWSHDQRMLVGITSENYMIAIATTDGPYDELETMLNTFQDNYGQINRAIMLDSGGSPAMMFSDGDQVNTRNDIKRSDDPLMSILFVYSGEACLNI